jgi:hypothetical protein
MNAPPIYTSRQLVLSAGIAVAVAAVVLVCVVLPAEYAIDPLRIGAMLGLTDMGNDKIAAEVLSGISLPAQAATQPDVQLMHAHTEKFRSARVEIQLRGREELEYKALLAIGEPLLYSWTVQGGAVHSEFHGEPTEGDWPRDFYQSYEIAEQSTDGHGSFVAPFTGQHGWYWRNLGNEPLTIVLETTGYYTKLGRISAGRIE